MITDNGFKMSVIADSRHCGNDMNDTNNPVLAQGFGYEYDTIGNRKTANGGTRSVASAYTANNLNQYTSVTSVQSVVNYSHDPDGNLTNDGAFVYTWDAENRLIAIESRSGVSAAFMKKLEFAYDYMGRRVNKKVYSWNSDSWLLTSDSSFIYDGWNLILESSTGVSPVELHAIEGLIEINPNNSPDNEFSLALPVGSTITRDGLQQDFAGYSGPALSIHVKPAAGGSQNGLMVDGETFSLDNSETYDITSHSMTVNLYNDRMKKGKAVGRWWISIQATSATITSGNVTPIPNQQSTITNYYVWGLDLSGSIQGAGGIGGLLCVSKSGTGVSPVSYFPTFDANGNVSELINPQSEITNPQSIISAHYEYSPFGETIVATGPMADDFPFRFSTKYLDPETDLYNYGYRYYSPELGRWLSRDPADEDYLRLQDWFFWAGIRPTMLPDENLLNLYLFVWNNALLWFDGDGKEPTEGQSCCENPCDLSATLAHVSVRPEFCGGGCTPRSVVGWYITVKMDYTINSAAGTCSILGCKYWNCNSGRNSTVETAWEGGGCGGWTYHLIGDNDRSPNDGYHAKAIMGRVEYLSCEGSVGTQKKWTKKKKEGYKAYGLYYNSPIKAVSGGEELYP